MQYFPHTLAVSFFIFFSILGVSPLDRDVWIVEVIPIIIIYFLLLFTYKKFKFSNLSYILMLFWLVGHTIGAHYTFANVPFDFITDLFDFQRNHFDRIGHFVIGFFAYPMAEFLTRKKYANLSWHPYFLFFS